MDEAKVLAQELAVVVAADGGAARAWLDELRAAALLVRPDRYLAGTASAGADLPGLLQRHFGLAAAA